MRRRGAPAAHHSASLPLSQAALLRPSLAGVARRRFEAARAAPAAQRAATRGGWDVAAAGEAAIYYSCFAHALAYLGGFLLIYTQARPRPRRPRRTRVDG